jgi:hypothetical protein
VYFLPKTFGTAIVFGFRVSLFSSLSHWPHLWLGSGPVRKFALPSGLLLCYHNRMAKSTSDNTKPRWRRSAETGTLVGVRLQPDDLAAVDAWRDKQNGAPTRPEAIRTLVRKALGRKPN